MKLLLFISFSAALLVSCKTTKPAASSETVISVMHGTNFGHCRGYCRKEVIFTDKGATYVESSVDSDRNPEKKQELQLSANDWKNITSKINWNTFNSLQESYGCPDCADGGSEYIEIQTAKGTKRVTIEFGKEQPELEPLLGELRAQRKKQLKD